MHSMRAKHQQQDFGGVFVNHQFQITDGESHHHVIQDVFGKTGTNTSHYCTLVIFYHFNNAQLLLFQLRLFFLSLFEYGCIVHALTYPQTYQHHHCGEPESHAPAPIQEGFRGQVFGKDEQDDGCHQVTQWHACLRPACPVATTVCRAVLRHQNHRSAPLATKGKALYQTQTHQQYWCPIAYALKCGNTPH